MDIVIETLEEETTTTAPAVPSMTKAETEHYLAVKTVIESATQEDKDTAQAIAETDQIRSVIITPVVAALIVQDYNSSNRKLSLSKVADYRGAMERGEWKVNHQGLAFYPDHTLADGQHRLNAAAVADIESIEIVVFPNFQKDAIDTIDRAKGRNAGEALEMMGITDGAAKANVMKFFLEYSIEVALGKKPRLTDPQIEAAVIKDNSILDQALHIADNSRDNIGDPTMSNNEARTIAFFMLKGGWAPHITVGFIASIQQGVASYPESPTVALTKAYVKARSSAKSADRLSRKVKTAITLKGLHLWYEQKTVARLTWKQGKETLPSYVFVAPEEEITE